MYFHIKGLEFLKTCSCNYMNLVQPLSLLIFLLCFKLCFQFHFIFVAAWKESPTTCYSFSPLR